MAYDQREGDFALFRNDRKTKESQPDWKGKGLWQGQQVELAGWEKDKGRGVFITGKFSEPRQPQQDGMGEYQGEPEPPRQPAYRPAPRAMPSPPSLSRPSGRPVQPPRQPDPGFPSDDVELPF